MRYIDQHKPVIGSILNQINKTIQAQSFINRYSKSLITDNCTFQMGGRTYVTTAFGDGLILLLGLLDKAKSVMSDCVCVSVAVYWVYITLACVRTALQ